MGLFGSRIVNEIDKIVAMEDELSADQKAFVRAAVERRERSVKCLRLLIRLKLLQGGESVAKSQRQSRHYNWRMISSDVVCPGLTPKTTSASGVNS